MWLKKNPVISRIVYNIKDTQPFFSGDDINMTAISKRLTLAILLRTSSVMAGASFLQKTDVSVQHNTTHVTWLNI